MPSKGDKCAITLLVGGFFLTLYGVGLYLALQPPSQVHQICMIVYVSCGLITTFYKTVRDLVNGE